MHYVYKPTDKNSNTWPFDLEQYLLLNVAIIPEIESSFTSSSMEIDYVRVYQERPISKTNAIVDNHPKIYPNPFSDEINISFENALENKVYFDLFDMAGKLIKHESLLKGNLEFKLDGLNEIQSGTYFLKIQNGEKIQSIKMIKR